MYSLSVIFFHCQSFIPSVSVCITMFTFYTKPAWCNLPKVVSRSANIKRRCASHIIIIKLPGDSHGADIRWDSIFVRGTWRQTDSFLKVYSKIRYILDTYTYRRTTTEKFIPHRLVSYI